MFVALAALVACKKTDRTRPTFTMTSPADSSIFATGQNIPFVATFFDNENLSQYKIDIHNNFDGHSNDKYLATIWSRIVIQNISGAEYSENAGILVPDSSASGWYHFMVTAADQAGNQSTTITRSIFIKNITDTTAPVVNLIGPTEGDIIPAGTSINVMANVTDNERVYILSIGIKRPNTTTNLFLQADTFGTNTVTYNKIIPTTSSTWTSGNYELTFTAYDSYYNKYVQLVHFQIN